MPKGPKIQTKGLVLYFQCPECGKMTSWSPETLRQDGTPVCQTPDDGGTEYHYEDMEYYGFLVVNNRS